jgi:hypothetical protein
MCRMHLLTDRDIGTDQRGHVNCRLAEENPKDFATKVLPYVGKP